MRDSFIELTDAKAQELAHQFGLPVATVREQYAIATTNGVEQTQAEMDGYIAEIEENLNAVIHDADKYLVTDPRERGMADIYEGMMAMTVPTEMPEPSDLLLKMSILIYKLAEARIQMASLADGQHRSPVGGK